MICETCGATFTPKHPRGRYCSGRCRVAAWEKRKAQARNERKRKVRGLLEEAIEVLGEGEDSP